MAKGESLRPYQAPTYLHNFDLPKNGPHDVVAVRIAPSALGMVLERGLKPQNNAGTHGLPHFSDDSRSNNSSVELIYAQEPFAPSTHHSATVFVRAARFDGEDGREVPVVPRERIFAVSINSGEVPVLNTEADARRILAGPSVAGFASSARKSGMQNARAYLEKLTGQPAGCTVMQYARAVADLLNDRPVYDAATRLRIWPIGAVEEGEPSRPPLR